MDVIEKINKFSDIYDLIKDKTSHEKGQVFEFLTKYIFKYHHEFYNKTKNIWLYDEIPEFIIKKFKLPEKDKGIDLLLETKDNEYYPIQCKFRSNINDSINWTDLSTFAGQLFVSDFKNAIYITNTYSIEKEISKCDKIQLIYGDYFNDDNLNEQFFDNIRNKDKKIMYAKKNLFNYQKEALKECNNHFKNNDRGYLSMACGTGKTLTTFHIDKIMKNKITLILVPSLYLLSQIYNEWTLESFGNDNEYILVGSDADDDSEKIPFLSTDKNLINKKICECNKKLIIISTYQSCDKIKCEKMIDLIIFDEAHKTVGDNGLFSYALFDENIKAKKKIICYSNAQNLQQN
jgi:predicted helicase